LSSAAAASLLPDSAFLAAAFLAVAFFAVFLAGLSPAESVDASDLAAVFLAVAFLAVAFFAVFLAGLLAVALSPDFEVSAFEASAGELAAAEGGPAGRVAALRGVRRAGVLEPVGSSVVSTMRTLVLSRSRAPWRRTGPCVIRRASHPCEAHRLIPVTGDKKVSIRLAVCSERITDNNFAGGPAVGERSLLLASHLGRRLLPPLGYRSRGHAAQGCEDVVWPYRRGRLP